LEGNFGKRRVLYDAKTNTRIDYPVVTSEEQKKTQYQRILSLYFPSRACRKSKIDGGLEGNQAEKNACEWFHKLIEKNVNNEFVPLDSVMK
jgi:hypothetical protein